jgi:hypothetical protein
VAADVTQSAGAHNAGSAAVQSGMAKEVWLAAFGVEPPTSGFVHLALIGVSPAEAQACVGRLGVQQRGAALDVPRTGLDVPP